MDPRPIGELTDDEFTVMMIMAEGESLAAIGRWEKPLDTLVARGLAHRNDKFNNTITPEGRRALADRAAADANAMQAAIPQIATAQEVARASAEQAAQALANAARVIAPVTGDAPETALIMWNVEVLKRARELLR